MMKEAAALWSRWIAAMSWQTAFVVIAVAAASWLARNRSPRLRYALWSLVILKLCLPPSLSLFTGITTWLPERRSRVFAEADVSIRTRERATPIASDAVATGVTKPHETQGELFTARRGNRAGEESSTETAAGARAPEVNYLETALFALWLAGVVALGIVVAMRRRRVTRLFRSAEGVDSPLLDDILHSLRFRGRVRLRACRDGIRSPATFGVVSPRIVLPASLLTGLSESELRSVLLHELCHIRRRDLWVNFLQTALQVVYWFHPFVWWANARVRREREMVVDDDVLFWMRGPRWSYADALARVAQTAGRFPRPAMGLLGIVERPSALAARLRRMSDPSYRATRRMSFISALLVVAVAALVIPQGRGSPKETRGLPGNGPAVSDLNADSTDVPRAEEILPADGEPSAEDTEIPREDAARDELVPGEEDYAARIERELAELNQEMDVLREEVAEIRSLVRQVLER